MRLYDKSKYEKYLLKFDGLEQIESNFSQSYQDLFVLSMLSGKRDGFYLEIGSSHPTFINNTFLLEKNFNWGGISIDIEDFSQLYSSTRRSRFLKRDALNINYEAILNENNAPSRIDYLQIDIEPSINTFNCLKNIPFDKYKFSVITYETDFYDPLTDRSISEKIREESRKLITSYGYELVVGDVENNGNDPFEDWYVDPNIVDKLLIEKIKNNLTDQRKPEDFLLMRG